MSNYTIKVQIEDTTKKPETSPTSPRDTSKDNKLSIPKSSLKSVAIIGAYVAGVNKVANTLESINGYVGEWTERRIAQRQFSVELRRTKQLLTGDIVGFAKTEAKLWLQYQLNRRKENLKSRQNLFISGNNRNTGSRFRGGRQ